MEQLYKINKISNNSYSSVRYASIIKGIVSEHIVPAQYKHIGLKSDRYSLMKYHCAMQSISTCSNRTFIQF